MNFLRWLRVSFDERRDLWILSGILLLAIFLRFWRLESVPAGVYPDEAANGLDIISMIQHHDFRVFYDTNGPREALFFYLQAPFVLLLGGTSLALRIAPALIGVATVFGIFLLVRLIWGTRAALVSSFLLAILPWHLTLSRDGFRAILVPLFTIFVLYFYLRGIRDRRLTDFFIGGLLLGLGCYTYTAYLFFPVLVLAMMIYMAVRFRGAVGPFVRPVLYSFVMAGLVLVPLVLHFVHHPAELGARVGGISVFTHQPSLGAAVIELGHNAARTALMFNVQGDANFRHNLGGFPLLDPVTGLLFLVGLVYFVSRIRKPTYLLVLAWLFFMLLPDVVTDERIPHALRSIGAIPPAVIIAGVGGTWAWSRVKATFPYNRFFQRALVTVVCLLAVLSVVYSYERYFRIWAPLQATHQAFVADVAEMARYVDLRPSGEHLYAVIDGYSDKSLQYLTWRRGAVQPIDPGAVGAAILSKGHDLVVATSDRLGPLRDLESRFPGGKERPSAESLDGRPDYLIYEVTR